VQTQTTHVMPNRNGSNL